MAKQRTYQEIMEAAESRLAERGLSKTEWFRRAGVTLGSVTNAMRDASKIGYENLRALSDVPEAGFDDQERAILLISWLIDRSKKHGLAEAGLDILRRVAGEVARGGSERPMLDAVRLLAGDADGGAKSK